MRWPRVPFLGLRHYIVVTSIPDTWLSRPVLGTWKPCAARARALTMPLQVTHESCSPVPLPQVSPWGLQSWPFTPHSSCQVAVTKSRRRVASTAHGYFLVVLEAGVPGQGVGGAGLSLGSSWLAGGGHLLPSL